MAKKSYKQCIKDKDWKSAISNFHNTTKRYKKYWFDCMLELYQVCKSFFENYILDKVNMTVEKIKHANNIDANDINITEKGKNLCYLCEFYNDKDLIYSKVGTTVRAVKTRIIEELKAYKKFGVNNAKILRVYDCGNLPPESLESAIRAEYIKQFPNSFKKNDRFMFEEFDLDFCDSLYEKLLE